MILIRMTEKHLCNYIYPNVPNTWYTLYLRVIYMCGTVDEGRNSKRKISDETEIQLLRERKAKWSRRERISEMKHQKESSRNTRMVEEVRKIFCVKIIPYLALVTYKLGL